MMNCAALTLALALASPTDALSTAQQLYAKARYEDALTTLGTECSDQNAIVQCEKLRGLLHAGLGATDLAQRAFARMLAANPKASIGEVAPKIRSMFDGIRAHMQSILNLRIAPPTIDPKDGRLLLEIKDPRANVTMITAHVTQNQDKGFDAVPMERQGEVWSAVVDVDPNSKHMLYFLEVRTSNQLSIAVDNGASPFQLTIAPEEIEHLAIAKTNLAATSPTTVNDKQNGLPKWAFWGLIGGGAAVVLTGVILGVVLATGGSDPGTINVNIVFEGE